MKRPLRATTVLRLAAVVLFFTAAPTAGDIGSCGQAPDDVDPIKFFTTKETIDCDHCTRCGLTSIACQFACDPGLQQSEFPEDCYPRVHDGEVCLNALAAASCAEYRQFMSDTAPTIPTECNFCPPCSRDGGAPDPDGGPELPRCD